MGDTLKVTRLARLPPSVLHVIVQGVDTMEGRTTFGMLLAGRLRQTLTRRRRARQALDAGSGTVMLALAGRLALERP